MKTLLLCLVFFPIVIAGCGDKKLVNDTAKPPTIFDETMEEQMLSEKDEHTLTESLDKEQGEFDSGVYHFENKQAMLEYKESEIFSEIGNNPAFINHIISDFEILEGPSKITRIG